MLRHGEGVPEADDPRLESSLKSGGGRGLVIHRRSKAPQSRDVRRSACHLRVYFPLQVWVLEGKRRGLPRADAPAKVDGPLSSGFSGKLKELHRPDIVRGVYGMADELSLELCRSSALSTIQFVIPIADLSTVMNVPVYSGPEVVQSSLPFLTNTLRSLLLLNYTVQSVTQHTLISHPWAPSCDLLVISSFSSKTSGSGLTDKVSKFVNDGGSLLAFSIDVKGRTKDVPASHEMGSSRSTILNLPNSVIVDFASSPTQGLLHGGAETVRVEGSTGDILTLVQSSVPRPLFTNLTNHPNVKVLGRFEDGEIAEAPRLDQPLVTVPSPSPDEEKRKLGLLRALRRFHARADKGIKDQNDTFVAYPPSDVSTDLPEPDVTALQPKRVIALTNNAFPPREKTPAFDVAPYVDELAKRKQNKDLSDGLYPWPIGTALMYDEVVTSTQTMLDGCLQFSLALRIPFAKVPMTKLVFLQYLFSLAVVEACRDEAVLGSFGEAVRIKWPNDIYVVLGEGERKELKKIGGILVNTGTINKDFQIVVGCGLNVLCPPPMCSLLQLILPEVPLELRMEKVAAAIMQLEPLLDQWIKDGGSFDFLTDLYLRRWPHSYVNPKP
ncbi:class II aaRS and biotin synthetase [Thelephora ganbajun]|uniref:Class II aaRS and biotin synthetase n=1 Tax=Thelephora ganbajun TaxID=370292 RepID=A0ACB6ZVD7_THEGA|nr:class II aaRS and biotin synthetase [Thelephora ganbajun]